MHVITEFDWNEVKRERQSNTLLKVNELILLVLRNGRVSGRTKLQKEVFLAWKEVFGEEYVKNPLYHPDQFGPYSKLVDDLQRKMKSDGLIKVVSKGEGHGTFSLLKTGYVVVEKIPEHYPLLEKSVRLLEERKKDWDEWTTKGIQRYVYRNYPEYSIKTRVPVLKW